LYLFYSIRKKNCYVQWQVFTYTNTVIGGLLFIAAGFLMSTGGALNGLMGISGYNNISMGRAYLPEVAGVFAASILCVTAIQNKVYLSTLMVLGFISLSLFHLTMFFHFYPGLDTGDFFWPMLLRGAGQVLLYLSLGIYVAENIPKHLSASRVIVSVFFKIIVGSFIGGAAFGFFMMKNKTQHLTGLSQQVTVHNSLALQEFNQAKYLSLSTGAGENESNQFATKVLNSKINQPASLIADKDLYLVCGLISLILALLVGSYKRLRHSPGKIVVEPVPL
jgi:DHA2 family multidrug resistance protein